MQRYIYRLIFLLVLIVVVGGLAAHNLGFFAPEESDPAEETSDASQDGEDLLVYTQGLPAEQSGGGQNSPLAADAAQGDATQQDYTKLVPQAQANLLQADLDDDGKVTGTDLLALKRLIGKKADA